MRRILFMVGIMVVSLPSLSHGAMRTVCPDGSGDYITIQAAINASVNGDVIVLCNGIFLGDGNRDIDYLGKMITVRSQGGNPEACIIDCGGNPHRGFNFHSGEGSGSVLKGVKVRNGFAATGEGGGIYCDGASPTIDNCILEDNVCPGGYGAGFFCRSSSPALNNCTFFNNGTGVEIAGGGMACLDYSSPILTGCVFEENRAQAGGGGMICAGISNPALTDCQFWGNSLQQIPGAWGGGLFCWSSASPVLEGCLFDGNLATCGGGIACYDHCDPVLTGCVFSENASGGGGGAFFKYICNPQLVDCTFNNNSGDYPVNGSGGAILCDASSPTLTTCTLAGNYATTSGGGIYLYQSSPSIERTIIAFNTIGESVYCYGTGSSPTLTCCDVYGNAGGDWVGCIAGQSGLNGNISLDPLFCDAANGNYCLADGSPCAPFTAPNPQCDLIGAWPPGCNAGVAEETVVESGLGLEAFPSPFTTSASIRYSLPARAVGALVLLDIYDTAGRRVRRLVDSQPTTQLATVEWDGRSQNGERMAAGIYFARLGAGREKVSRPLILIR
ncbi:MAG: hypothetical protein KJ970_13575 [Candidatus Eisenbacteria bacterium]|uniref:T9SS type A sorting domain-containing protein n=1 Tax=Eiseniibacteriota bacterium TaxID=2212470 RepID=A0A948W6W0_UNCEI|nr:hypothetical protein [Candidatus Eisenbacteria bacterium]MBU1947608.1 hypothetical protein [Candidatus Eisenbacteria bacterium]MBU2691944.1 hypothetical protein [Candidatus Eisenbacteria bacterium]